MLYNDNVDRFSIGLPLLSTLILTGCVLVTISLLPLPAALAQNTSTEVNALIEKGADLDSLGNYTGAIKYYDKALAMDPKYVAATI